MQWYNSGLFAEQGINLNRARQCSYTQLSILYAKHSNMFWLRLNIQTLLRPCKHKLHWKATVLPFLYTHYD